MSRSLIEIENFPALARAFASVSKETGRTLRRELRDLAEPIAASATQFASADISGIARQKTEHWEEMRVGVARGFSLVYVAPRHRGIKGRGDDPRRRPKFADTLRDKAMTPAVEANEAGLVAGAESVVDEVTGRIWSHGS